VYLWLTALNEGSGRPNRYDDNRQVLRNMNTFDKLKLSTEY